MSFSYPGLPANEAQYLAFLQNNAYFGTILLDMYCRLGMVDAASQVFDSISERNVESWTTVISGLVQHDHAEEGLVLFNKVRLTGVEPNEYTMGSILSACSSLDALVQGRWNQGYVLKNEISFIGSALWDGYVKGGKVTDAYALIYIDHVSWTDMVVGYITQLEAMNPQKIDAPFYAYSIGEVQALTPLEKFRIKVGRKAYITVSDNMQNSGRPKELIQLMNKFVGIHRRRKVFDPGGFIIISISISLTITRLNGVELF
ncbi:hypothetical protein IEQ34_007162 [Dendrobium chrysotoxum]|uniref:Pentatricopeptide repeat-containing protein n=1 Tax=Dendrobium chrysotoxum TaxID=161865 RepID=A0AAV7H724_DENCH|nr:hypothetical protein IEQ34_007162 [Dendrobium chrysotoxum]